VKREKEASDLQSFSLLFVNQKSEGKFNSLFIRLVPWTWTAYPKAPPVRRFCGVRCQQKWAPYLLSPRLGPCSSMPAVEVTVPPPELLSALELWEGGSGLAGAKVLPSVGGSGGWKAGDICFLFKVPLRRWAWKSISFTPKLHREKKQSAHQASRLQRQKPDGFHVLKTYTRTATQAAQHAEK
jgi:hypothetical protein